MAIKRDTGFKFMKLHSFAIAALFLALAAPSAAQLVSSASNDFIDAVRKSDGGRAIELLRDKPSGLINLRGYDGDTALMIAIQRRDDEWTGFLLDKGADPDLPAKNGDTPLIAAARLGYDSAIGWLLAEGAKVDGTNRSGETALIVAVQLRQVPVIRQLLEAGANPDKTDSAQGYSAREYAARDPRARDILKMITDRKPKP